MTSHARVLPPATARARAAAEVTPIREFDHRPIGEGRRGPVTEQLQKLFFDAVNGRDPAHADWLTPVAR